MNKGTSKSTRHTAVQLAAALLAILATRRCDAESTKFVYASDYKTAGQILRYDPVTGDYLGVLASGNGMNHPDGLCFGPEGTIYVAASFAGKVMEVDRDDGGFIRNVCMPPTNVEAVELGPDGLVYATRWFDKIVRRYNPATGGLVGQWGPIAALVNPVNLRFGPDGNLYVCGHNSGVVAKIDGATGAVLAVLDPPAGTGITMVEGLAFGPDGLLYVAGANNGKIARFNVETGAFIDVFTQTPEATNASGITFLCSGNLLVSVHGSGNIHEFDAATGALVQTFQHAPGTRGSGLLAWPGQPGIQRPPAPALACPVGTASFSVAAVGSTPIAFEWQRETAPGSGEYVSLVDGSTGAWDGGAEGVGAVVGGSTTATLTIGANLGDERLLGAVHAVRVRCRVTNDCGSIVSFPAQLSISDCRGDLDCSGAVDGGDIGILLGAWGAAAFAQDLDGDGIVGGGDLGTLLGAWGGCEIIPG